MNTNSTETGAAKALWMLDSHDHQEKAEQAWAEMTMPDDWTAEALDYLERAKTVLAAARTAPQQDAPTSGAVDEARTRLEATLQNAGPDTMSAIAALENAVAHHTAATIQSRFEATDPMDTILGGPTHVAWWLATQTTLQALPPVRHGGSRVNRSITIPRPHVPYGPHGVAADQADTDYLRQAADDLEIHYKPFGSNLRATVVKLIRDAADSIQAPAADPTDMPPPDVLEAGAAALREHVSLCAPFDRPGLRACVCGWEYDALSPVSFPIQHSQHVIDAALDAMSAAAGNRAANETTTPTT